MGGCTGVGSGVATKFLFSTLRHNFLNLKARFPAVWILAAKLPNSDLNFAMWFFLGVDFFFLFSLQGKTAPSKKNPRQKNLPQNSPRIWSEKLPSDFRRSVFLKLSVANISGDRGTHKAKFTRALSKKVLKTLKSHSSPTCDLKAKRTRKLNPTCQGTRRGPEIHG